VRDAIIIGGGFYGVAVASYLADKRGFADVALVEQEDVLLGRASLHNQARVHNGYHYPRSFVTAFRSRINLPRFAAEFADCVVRDFVKVYAVARRNSLVSSRQFQRFCAQIGARLEALPRSLSGIFDRSLVEEAFVVQEYAFDAARLANWADECLASADVERYMGTRVDSLRKVRGGIQLGVSSRSGAITEIESRYVFNCTYSGLNGLGGEFPGTASQLKHEVTEMALLEMPRSLASLGVTVVDGPFFSAMPYPARGLHSLSHVRYTPHCAWRDQLHESPYPRLEAHERVSRFDWMMRDATRYMPALADARYVDSMYEIKTVLQKNEADDGRPILFEKHAGLPGCYSILGGKIDNIYDILARLDHEQF
jgi:glycine/D-amino acid oxidase-like deaminating enzyme